MSSKRNMRAGSWTREEDGKLRDYVNRYGARQWDSIGRNLGRSGNSSRLRWNNYLSPHIRRGEFTEEEKRMILKLRCEGNGWSKIAKKLPAGRTDNDIKNFWNTRVKKEAKQLMINCDVGSEEFLRIITARLTSTPAADPGGGDGTTDTSVISFSTGSSHQVVEDRGSIESTLLDAHDSNSEDFWQDLAHIWSLDEIEPSPPPLLESKISLLNI